MRGRYIAGWRWETGTGNIKGLSGADIDAGNGRGGGGEG